MLPWWLGCYCYYAVTLNATLVPVSWDYEIWPLFGPVHSAITSNKLTCFVSYPTVGQLGPNDLKTVLTELHDDSDRWYNLGLALDLTPGVLNAIDQRHRHPNDCLRDALSEWLNTSPDPSWVVLVQALRSTIVGRESSARRLEQEYCTQERSEPPAGKNDLKIVNYSQSSGWGYGE